MNHFKIFAVFLVSIADLSYEIYVMRIFSIGGWSAFGSLVISAALLGVGVSAIIITFTSKWVEKYSSLILRVCAIAMPLLMAGAAIIAQRVPFNPIYLSSDIKQLWYIGAYYLIYGVPFFCNAAFIGVMFCAQRQHIQKLCFWNMIGSGAGGFFIIMFMFFLPPQFLIMPILCIAIIAALFTCIAENNKTNKFEIEVKHLAAVCTTSILSMVLIFAFGSIRVSDSKAISYVRKYPDSKLVHHSYTPGSEYHVYYSKYFHFAPGLSDNAALQIPNMPVQPYWGLFVDGSGPIGIMGYLRENEKAYMDYLPMASPYTVLDKPKVLLVNLSGGINTQIARYKEASRIDILEPSPKIIELLKYDPNVTRFTGGLLSEKTVNVVQNEGRTWCRTHHGAYDLIEISLVDSIGLTDSGGYPVQEDFKWTVEAFKEYFEALRPNGILSITVWDKLNPPRNVLKLTNTIVTAMSELDIQKKAGCFYSFGLFMSTSTILVKKTPWHEEELKKLDNFVESRSFELFYAPNKELSEYSPDTLISTFNKQFKGLANTTMQSYSSADLYRSIIPRLISGYKQRIENDYMFDIREIRDSRPYYSGYLKLSLLPTYLKNINAISEEWGYLLLLGMLVQACLFGALVIIVPIIFRWKITGGTIKDGDESVFSGRTIGVILYYAGLGLAYMLIEIYLIQRLGLYLANPIYSTSIVISVMLISSALGNIASTPLKSFRPQMVAIACAFIAIALFVYIFALDGILAASSSASFFSHIIISILVIAPVAFFMGIPYPNGLDSLQQNSPALLPWAWGMNGGLSVAGSALARVLSVSQGFPVLLTTSIVIYLVVALIFNVNGPRPIKTPPSRLREYHL